MQRPNDKAAIYKWIRVSGLLALIPISLFAGPFAGYMAGEWIARRFGAPLWTPAACAGLGLLGGAVETIRVIRAALTYTKE